jgi:heterotetrameric sarcosine oxidase beta subunit
VSSRLNWSASAVESDCAPGPGVCLTSLLLRRAIKAELQHAKASSTSAPSIRTRLASLGLSRSLTIHALATGTLIIRVSCRQVKTTAEVVIIGGGCMGASTAYHLTRNGLRDVVLLEREPMLGMGSTGRNAGGVRHQFSSEANVKLSIESIRVLERFTEEVGYEIDFHQDGYLFVLSNEKDVIDFRRNVEMQRALGVEVALLTPDEAQTHAPGLEVEGVIGATFCARDGIADPNGVTMGFAKSAQAAGAVIYRETEVTGIRTEAGRVSAVETTRGTISTHMVVNAAGPYARDIGTMVGLDVPILPYRRHIFITEPIPPSSPVPGSRIMVIDFETTFYFHREGAGILFGMSDPHEPSSYNSTVSWEFLEKVTRTAIKRLPALADAGIAHAWAGLYEMTPDAMPIIGPAHAIDGMFIIAGFSGHGFQHSPAAGRVLAEMIVNGEARDFDPAPFSFDRFSRGSHEREENVV